MVFGGALAALAAAPGGPVIFAALVVAGAAAGVVMTLGADLVMSAAHQDRAGEAAAIQETSFELGAGLGVAVLGTVLAVVYRAALPAAPAGARESLGAATEIAGTLAPTQAYELLQTAREAFHSGLSATLAGAAALLWLTAVVSVVLLRDPGEPSRLVAARSGSNIAK
jgi:DHA2 family multidrug resistance protein-like MFS transporter